MLRVNLQAMENYGADTGDNYWKMKFGAEIIVKGTDDRPANAMALVVNHLAENHNGDMFRYYPISWEIALEETGNNVIGVIEMQVKEAVKQSVTTDTKVTTTMMETSNGETWHSKDIEVSLTACSSCGLLWDRKWQAESCEERGHVESFPQHYGGYVENDEYKPSKTYIRKSYGRN